ncbi:hypothetical protein OGAPHI_007071 [Ogataea philodendri]|uniref:N-acetyltransferase ECO1 n=1 Tax=Ogataea philodendri TaxID=1378263 RepID=A0A9P8T039_9ASCO|nr:uncharacterized protein OGAPHI_007071 [Ogataea philodendri]KAH3660485.1 hypothetical protein OGAPHI_007071 [Ogataea philodendri]
MELGTNKWYHNADKLNLNIPSVGGEELPNHTNSMVNSEKFVHERQPNDQEFSRTTNSGSKVSKNSLSKVRKGPQQLYFNSSLRKTICPQCQMSYIPHLKADQQSHNKYHERAVEGIDLGPGFMKFGIFIKNHRLKSGVDGRIVEINPSSAKETAVAVELLKIANTVLNAPEGNKSWLSDVNGGKVFLFLIRNKAVAICSTERVNAGQWMVYESGKIVPHQSVPLVMGISRIYVSHKYRRLGIAMHLLRAIEDNSVYGVSLKNTQIGWSQPSEFGGKLACSYNGVRHKSGKILLPVYEE